jgi:hypothetical protein
MSFQIVPNAVSTASDDWLDITDPRELKTIQTIQTTQTKDINAAFDDITLSCFDVYQKTKEKEKEKEEEDNKHPSTKKFKPYLSKKKQDKQKNKK